MVFSGTARRVQQFVCGLHGHEMMRHFDRDRVSLQCVSCGHESPGWVVQEPPTRKPDPGNDDHPAAQHRHAA